jgi:hypothetical protein|tara:strand:- start:1956 stop:2141 length:186 start_codon:yes stop_codon:yes gene_type:complete
MLEDSRSAFKADEINYVKRNEIQALKSVPLTSEDDIVAKDVKFLSRYVLQAWEREPLKRGN